MTYNTGRLKGFWKKKSHTDVVFFKAKRKTGVS